LLTDFVCLYNYEFWLSLCNIVRSSVILLLPLSTPENSNNGAFLDIVTNASASETSIPRGKKENQYFVIDNDGNGRRRAQGKNRKFIDDCGVWKSASLKTHYFVYNNGQYQYVDLKDGIYSDCFLQESSNRSTTRPIFHTDIKTHVQLTKASTRLQKAHLLGGNRSYVTNHNKKTGCSSRVYWAISRQHKYSW
jgi:hypothetical protein